MKKFIWDNKYSVDIQIIDEQHKHFFDITNNILGNLENELIKENILALLNELGNYALYHLSTEEEYFDKFKYIDAVEHIAAHNKFRTLIKEYLSNIVKEGVDIKMLAEEIATFAANWLLEHILIMDKKYSEVFHEHGLK